MAAIHSLRTRSISSGAKAGLRTTSASSATDSSSRSPSADTAADEVSSDEPLLKSAPRDSARAAIASAPRLRVPSSSKPRVKLAVPGLRPWSAAKPASNSADTRTTGTPGRLAITTGRPLASVWRSSCGNATAGNVAVAGSPVLRSTALAAALR